MSKVDNLSCRNILTVKSSESQPSILLFATHSSAITSQALVSKKSSLLVSCSPPRSGFGHTQYKCSLSGSPITSHLLQLLCFSVFTSFSLPLQFTLLMKTFFQKLLSPQFSMFSFTILHSIRGFYLSVHPVHVGGFTVELSCLMPSSGALIAPVSAVKDAQGFPELQFCILVIIIT